MQNSDKKHEHFKSTRTLIFRNFFPLQTALSTGLASISSGRHDVDPEAVATGRGELRLCPLKRSCGAFSSSFSRRTLNKLPELTPHEENACIFEESPSSAPQL